MYRRISFHSTPPRSRWCPTDPTRRGAGCACNGHAMVTDAA
jgi:hypothetical protein